MVKALINAIPVEVNGKHDDPGRGAFGGGQDPHPLQTPGPAGFGRLRHLCCESSRTPPRCPGPVAPPWKTAWRSRPTTRTSWPMRKTVVELILSAHPNDCQVCGRNTQCELQNALADFGIREEPYDKIVPQLPKDATTGTIVLDPAKCIKCGRCVVVCQEVQNVWALSFSGTGHQNAHRPGGGHQPGRIPLRALRPMLGPLPNGRHHRVQDDTGKVWTRAPRPEETLRCPDRARRAGDPGRTFRVSNSGRQFVEENLHSAPPHGVRGGVRHELRGRLDHLGRGGGIRPAVRPRQGRSAPHHHLLPLLGGLHGEIPRRHDRPFLLGKIAPRDGRRPGKDVLRPKERPRPGKRGGRLHHALHVEKVRDPTQSKRCAPRGIRTSTRC
jgi:ferredoxin